MNQGIATGAIEALIAHSVARAAEKASAADVERGVVAGLRLIRRNVGDQLGYMAACQFDDALRHTLINAAIERGTYGGGHHTAQLFPEPPSAGSARSVAILTEAVRSCLTLNSYAPGNQCVNGAASALTHHLLALAGDVPDWQQLETALHYDENDHQDEEDSEGPFVSYLQ